MIEVKENFSASSIQALDYLKEIMNRISPRFTKTYMSITEVEETFTIPVEFFEPESKLPVSTFKVKIFFKVPKSLKTHELIFHIESEAVDYPLFNSINLNYFQGLLDRVIMNKIKMSQNLLLHSNFESSRLVSLDGESVKLFTLDEEEDILSDNNGEFFCSQNFQFLPLDTPSIDKLIKLLWKTLSSNKTEFIEYERFKLLFEYGKVDFSDSILRKLWKYVDPTKRGKVNYKEFNDFCMDMIQCMRAYHISLHKNQNNDCLNLKIKSAVEIMNLHFKEYDTQANGEITYDNLKKCLLKENELFTRKEIEIILKYINPDKNFEYWKFDRILKILYVDNFDYSALMKQDKIFNYLIKIFEKQDTLKTKKLDCKKMKYAFLIDKKLKLNKVQILMILYFFNIKEEIPYYKASLIIRDILDELFSPEMKSQKTDIQLPQYLKFEKYDDSYDAHLKNISNIFIRFDLDYDHLLSSEEFNHFLVWLLPFLKENDYTEIFQLCDTNGDRVVSYSEFKQHFESLMNMTRIKTVFKEISNII